MVIAPPFKTIITGDGHLDRVQQNISQTVQSIQSGPFINGRFIQSVSIKTSGSVINHGLGRQPKIWALCDQNTNTSVWRTDWNENSITLVSGANCIVSLWVS